MSAKGLGCHAGALCRPTICEGQPAPVGTFVCALFISSAGAFPDLRT